MGREDAAEAKVARFFLPLYLGEDDAAVLEREKTPFLWLRYVANEEVA